MLTGLTAPSSVSLNDVLGTVCSFDNDADRYVVHLKCGRHVRARPHNVVSTNVSMSEFVAELHGFDNAARSEVAALECVHGEGRVAQLLRELIEDVPHRSWTVAEDLHLLINLWSSRAMPGASMRTPLHPLQMRRCS